MIYLNTRLFVNLYIFHIKGEDKDMNYEYEILDAANVLLPEEIFYLNLTHHDMEYHVHAPGSVELNYIVDGECFYDIDSEIFPVKKRSLILVNGHIPHKLICTSPCINMSINCYQHTLSPNFGTLCDLTTAYPALASVLDKLKTGIILPNAKNIYPLMQLIFHEFGHGKDPYYMNLLLNNVLILIQKQMSTTDPTPAQIYVEKVKNYIHYHYFSIKDIDEIADFAALNKVYLQKIFKRETGTTLWNYLTRFRLDKAAYLLCNSDIPIGDIDEMIGINSRQNFYLLFKKIYGMSPSEYKRIHKKS